MGKTWFKTEFVLDFVLRPKSQTKLLMSVTNADIFAFLSYLILFMLGAFDQQCWWIILSAAGHH